jgi:hypothetical protein
MARKSPAKTVKKLDPDQLARREGIFCIYRDLGATRSYDRLMAVIKDSHGEVSRRTLTNWSRQHSWQERTAEHDRDLQIGSQGRSVALDANFDQKDALLRTAHLALQRALESTPVVRTAQDLKALVDAANTAIKLTELLNAGERGRPDQGASKQRMFELLDKIEARVRAAHQAEQRVIEAQAVPRALLPPPREASPERPPPE